MPPEWSFASLPQVQPSQQRHVPGIVREVAQQRIAAQPLDSGVAERDRPIEPGKRLVNVAEVSVRLGDLEFGTRGVFYQSLQCGVRLSRTTLRMVSERQPQDAPGALFARELPHSLRHLAASQQNAAELVVRRRKAGVDLKHLTNDFLGLIEPSSVVQQARGI